MLGANGAGKTTLFRAALGLIPLAAGAIRMFGAPAPRRGAVGYMPQNRGAVATARLTGYAMIASAAMGARFGFSRLDKATRREIDWALDQVDARELARRPIAELSGGERQRLLLEPGAAWAAETAAARRALDLARSRASARRGGDRRAAAAAS